MPVVYALDRLKRRILTRCEGETSLAEVLAHFAELERDDACPMGADVLLDLSSMTSLPNVGQIRMAAERTGRASRRVRFRRCAIVAPSDALFDILQAYEAFSRDHFAESRVFRTVPGAVAWLDQRQEE